MRYFGSTDFEMLGRRTEARPALFVVCYVLPNLARPGLFGD